MNKNGAIVAQRKPTISDQAKRLHIIYEEWSITQPEKKTLRSIEAFAKFIGIGKVTLYYQLNGTYPVSKKVIDIVCYKLGYHPAWVINGKGHKKSAMEEKKTLTEVQQLKVKIDILEQYVFRLEERMKYYEKNNHV